MITVKMYAAIAVLVLGGCTALDLHHPSKQDVQLAAALENEKKLTADNAKLREQLGMVEKMLAACKLTTRVQATRPGDP